MTKDEALALLGVSQAELARRLGITRGAVALWKKQVPLLRQFQIQTLAKSYTRGSHDGKAR